MIEIIHSQQSKSRFRGVPHFFTYTIKPGNSTLRLGIDMNANPRMVLKWLKLRGLKIRTLTATNAFTLEIEEELTSKRQILMKELKRGGIL